MKAENIITRNNTLPVVAVDKYGHPIMWQVARDKEVVRIILTDTELKVMVDYKQEPRVADPDNKRISELIKETTDYIKEVWRMIDDGDYTLEQAQPTLDKLEKKLNRLKLRGGYLR